MTDFFDSDLDRLERFSDEAREKLRSLSEDIEREVARSLQLLQKLEQLQGTINGAPVEASAIADFRSVGAVSGGDLLSSALDSAINRAASNVLRGGKVNGRSILRSGAGAIGTALGQAVTGGMRLSITQTALEFSRQLARGSRNG